MTWPMPLARVGRSHWQAEGRRNNIWDVIGARRSPRQPDFHNRYPSTTMRHFASRRRKSFACWAQSMASSHTIQSRTPACCCLRRSAICAAKACCQSIPMMRDVLSSSKSGTPVLRSRIDSRVGRARKNVHVGRNRVFATTQSTPPRHHHRDSKPDPIFPVRRTVLSVVYRDTYTAVFIIATTS